MKAFASLRTSLIALLSTVATAPAIAQGINYSELEQLFGEPVTTSATGKPQRVTEVPANMDIITQTDIKRSGAKDIPTILQRLAGISVESSGARSYDVAVRGYNQPGAPRLLVLINGRQVYLDHYGLVAWSTLPVQLAEIQQIEVVRGPNSALFGFNAAAGVINIVTTNPLTDSVNSASVSFGNDGQKNGSLVATTRVGDRIGLRLSLGGDYAEQYKGVPKTIYDLETGPFETSSQYQSNPLRGSIAFDGRAKLTDKIQIGAEVTRSYVRQTDVIPEYQPNKSKFQTTSFKTNLIADTELGLIEASVYRNMLDLSYTNFRRIDVHNKVDVAQVSNLFKVGADHTFRLSAEYRENSIESVGNVTLEPSTMSYQVASLGAMWDWAITPSLSLTNAVRGDLLMMKREGAIRPEPGLTNADWNRDLRTFSFNSGLVWRATQDDTVRLLAARGVQVPSLINWSFQAPPSIFGQPYVNPTYVTNVELSYDRVIDPINANLRLAVFHQRNKDLQYFNVGKLLFLPPRSQNPILGFTNIGDSTANGFEIGLKSKPGEGLRWSGNYSLIKVKDRMDDDATVTTAPLAPEKTTPKHMLNASIGYSWGALEADIFGRYISSADYIRPNPDGITYDLTRVEGYFNVDARLGYALSDNFDIAVSGQNLLIAHQLQRAGIRPDRRFLVTLTGRF
jgi:outer membrane receptor for ferrienterochelin and colicins